MAYLDWNATAPLRPEARAAWLAAQDEAWGNPASVHAEGQRARDRLDRSLASCAAALGCRAHELVLVSGGTEANAAAIHAAVAAARARAVAAPTVLALASEHSSVLANAAAYARLVELPVDGDGLLAPAALAAAGDDTALVCLQFANNETGVLQDLPALVAEARRRAPRALLLVDCCQGAGKAALDLAALGCDFASIAGHKLGAPKGVGLLYVRAGVRPAPLIAGGRQQQDRRSGTEDPALAAALAAALTAAGAALAAEEPRQRALRDGFEQAVRARLPAVRVLGAGAPRLANTSCLVHPGVDGRQLVQRLDLAGFQVSTGAACRAARGQPSHVVAALGVEPALARSALRVSLGWRTTAAEVEAAAAGYVAAVTALAGGGPDARRA